MLESTTYDAVYEMYNWDKFIFVPVVSYGTRECLCCREKNIKKGDTYCSVTIYRNWSRNYPRPWGDGWVKNLCLNCAKELMLRTMDSGFNKLKDLEGLIEIEKNKLKDLEELIEIEKNKVKKVK